MLFTLLGGVACVGTSSVHTGALESGLAGPTFPGSGQSGQNLPIVAGFTPNACLVAGSNAGFQVVGGYKQTCYYGGASSTIPMAFVEQVVETAQGLGLVHVRLAMNPSFVDNTYGLTAVGWATADAGAPPAPGPGGAHPGPAMAGMPAPPGAHGHTFRDLYESDHAEFFLSDASGAAVMSLDLDYLSANSAAPSGYASLGVGGGDGKMLKGDASAIAYYSTSLDRDLNACGYSSYTTNSPATDSSYSVNSAAPNWDYRVVYDVWVAQAAFAAGFGDATIPYVHASPSKTSSTIPVKPGPCPPPHCTGEGCFDGGSPLPQGDGGAQGGCTGQGCTDGGRMCVGEVCEDGGFSCSHNGSACASSAQCCSTLCFGATCVAPPL